jgi:hypothetical protein
MSLDDLAEAVGISDSDKCPITTSFRNLFSILSTWDPKSDLILDISIYSPSDSEHWFKYLTFLPDTPSQTISTKAYDDAQHGWVAGSRRAAPHRWAFTRVFHEVMEQGPFDSDDLEFEWWDQLPSVPAVTSVLLRQQNRRRWKPDALAHMFTRFPRLQEVHYEPWREWGRRQIKTDKGEYRCQIHLPMIHGNIANYPPLLSAHLPRFLLSFRLHPTFQPSSQEARGL